MQLIEKLHSTKEQTLALFELEEVLLARSYGPEKWNVKQVLHHIVDAETVLYDRIRRCISNAGQVVWGFDQDAWARELRYTEIPLDKVRPIYEAVRTMVIYQAERFYEEKGHLEVVHSGTGKRTLKELFDKVVWHNEMHLEHIKKALSETV